MAFLDTLNNSFELNITPSRKRKRKFDQEQQNKTTASTSCFTNAAFSSTPKKILGKRRIQLNKNNENGPIFSSLGLEVKSIAKLTNHEETNNMPHNPYEVLRKPPKKKTRHSGQIACFENPGLNLELPEKLFNPFEVVREVASNKSSNCFSNPALNLKVQDGSLVCNPFEVQRDTSNRDLQNGGANPVSLNPFEISQAVMQQGSLTPKPCKLKLGLPFVPRVGCRIDFKDIPQFQLTPSKLLAEKLVFSPVAKAKVNLSSVGEETTMDIGKELDRYQLELENSINEAKLRKTVALKEDILFSPPDTNYSNISDGQKKSKPAQTLYGIPEDTESEQIIEETTKEEGKHIEACVQRQQNGEKVEKSITDTNPFQHDLITQYQRAETAEVVDIQNMDELYACSVDDQEDEDSFDFKSSVPFVRAYTKPDASIPKLTVSKESLESKKFDKLSESDDYIQKSVNIKSVIRKSIRKLINTHHNALKEAVDDSVKKPECERNNGFMSTIRQSLRRKPGQNLVEKPVINKSEISIIDCTERTMKLKSDVLENEYVKIEDLTNEKKYNLRNSIRKSSREVRNQILKSVFHKKHEEYYLYK